VVGVRLEKKKLAANRRVSTRAERIGSVKGIVITNSNRGTKGPKAAE